MFENDVLMPTDFSHYALYAMNYAIAFARRSGATLHIAHVLDPTLFSVGSGHGVWLTHADQERLAVSMRCHAEERLCHLARLAAEAGVRGETHIVEGHPPHEIANLADGLGCGLIVIATHGRTGFDHVVFGSVAEHVVRDARVPVLSVKHPEHEFVENPAEPPSIRTVLYPSDFSNGAERALPAAATICREFGARLVLMHANEAPFVLPEFMPDAAVVVGNEMEAQAQAKLDSMRSEALDIETETRVTLGVAYREIIAAAAEYDADLIVLHTHGRRGLAHVLFGSVAEKVVRCATCPVLTIRTTEALAA